MATIADLVLKLRGDNTELRQMFADSAQRAQGFTTVITDAMEMAGRNVQRQAGMGALAAKAFLESLERSFAMDLAHIKEQQYAMFITPEEADRQAGMAALAFNDTLTQTLGNLRESGHLTSTLEIQLTGALKKAGLKAGVQLQEAIAEGIREGSPAVTAAAESSARGAFTAYSTQAEGAMAKSSLAVTKAGGEWTTFGRRGATALMGLGFGIESFANGTEGGMRRALRSVESFAIFMGPEGLLAAALITAGLAIYDHFHKIQKAIDETLKRAVSAASQAANAMDQIGLQKALRDIQQGTATSVDPSDPTKLLVNKRSEYAQNAFEGSGADLEAHLAAVNKQIEEATRNGQISLVGTLKKQADALDAQAQPLRDRYNQIADLIRNPPPQMRMPEAAAPVVIQGKNAHQQEAEATKEYYTRLQLLITQMDMARAAGKGYADQLERVLAATTALGGTSARPGEKPEDTERRINMLRSLQKALSDIGPKVNVSITDPSGAIEKAIDLQQEKMMTAPTAPGVFADQSKAFDNLVAQAKIYRDNIELTNASLRAQGKQVIDIDKAMEPLRSSAAAMAIEMRKAMRDAGLDPAIVDLLVQHWIEGLGAIGNAGKDTAGKLQQMADVLGSISELAGALGDAGSAQILSNIGNAVNSVGAAVAAGGKDPVADINAAASIVTAVKSLFDSPAHREQLEAMRENNRHLHEVSLRLQGFAPNAGNQVAAGQAAANALANNAARGQIMAYGTGMLGNLQGQINALTPFLKSVGLTWEQFAKIAADSGIRIFDSAGRIMLGPLEQFAASMNDAIRALFTFQNTLSDQQSLANLQQTLSGRPVTPQTTVDQNLALIQKLAPNLLPSGASAQGADNQDALRKMLQDLVARIQAGTVNNADYGGFQNLQELVSVIEATAGALNDLRNVTNGVTAALTNVPAGFKLALAEFDAQDAQQRPQVPDIPTYVPPARTYPSPPLTPPWQPPMPTYAPDTLTVTPPTSGGDTHVYFTVESGAIAIDPTNKNASEIGRETLDSLQELALHKLGNRARWAEMN